MSDTIAAFLGLAAAGLGLLSAVLVVLLRAEREKSLELARQVYENKRAAYGQFSDMINKLLTSAAAQNLTPGIVEELKSELFAIRKEIWKYGSPEVLRTYSEFNQLTFQPVEDKSVSLILIGRVLLSMRIDMGLSNEGVDELDILRLFITDIDTKYEGAMRAAANYLESLRSVKRPTLS